MIGSFIKNLFTGVLPKPLFIIFLVLVVAGIVIIVSEIVSFHTSTYKKKTNKKSLLAILLFNKGAIGEYLIYDALKKYEKKGAKFFFNLYVPKENGDSSEIDVVMVNGCGVYVFESKNYSGWIFGNSRDQYWTQSLRSGKGTVKNRFFNPVMQNAGHIKALAPILGDDVTFHSFIVFSNRCELKKITVDNGKIKVLKRENLKSAVSSCEAESEKTLGRDGIDRICSILSNFEHPDEATKQAHDTQVSNYNHRR